MLLPLWQHQREDLDRSWQLPGAALFWEPRLGKSRVVIETAERLYDENKINACVVVAPNGVHLNWSRDQLPRYWGTAWPTPPRVVEWRSGRAGTKAFQRELDAALIPDGFLWFVCNVEAVAATALSKFLYKLTGKRKCLLVIDESHYVKNPHAKRTRAVMRLAERCPFRRILSGTPTPQGPFDLWSQFFLLDPTILGPRYTTFKQRYGIWKRVSFGGPTFDQLVEYRNLDELTRRTLPLSFPRKKSECFDLPERLFTRRYFEMAPEHARLYRQLRDELLIEIESGVELAAPLAIVRLMKLQQVARGHVADETGLVHDLPGGAPAVDSVVELLGAHRGKAIVWCRFVRDAEKVVASLQEAFPESTALCVGYVSPEDRVALRTAFNDPASSMRFWVGTPATGGVGVDLGTASLMIFYSHGYDLAQRLQALERNYGDSQKADRVEVVDLIAADTIDEKILDVLDRKEGLMARLLSTGIRDILF